jgi:hypothetical protein
VRPARTRLRPEVGQFFPRRFPSPGVRLLTGSPVVPQRFLGGPLAVAALPGNGIKRDKSESQRQKFRLFHLKRYRGGGLIPLKGQNQPGPASSQEGVDPLSKNNLLYFLGKLLIWSASPPQIEVELGSSGQRFI